MIVNQDRLQHKSEVISFLESNFASQNWMLSLPPKGSERESYCARSDGHSLFIKLGVQIERYQVISKLGLSPQVIEIGQLEDGMSIVVQSQIDGRKPSRKDFHQYLEKFAQIIRKTHESESLSQILPQKISDLHKDVGLETLNMIEHRWEKCKSSVPASVKYVDESLGYLRNQINQFGSKGLVASHNDICNANWIMTDDRIYLIDFDSMSQDDPATDLGAFLWWYYPPKMRSKFLKIVGYENDDTIHERMKIRMAMHCLHIILPRENSFDTFGPDAFDNLLDDFRAVISGEENPKGYYD